MEWFLLILAAGIYLIPACNAVGRHHNNAGAIFALNLLLGWTLLGWISALIWSLTSNVKKNEAAAPRRQVIDKDGYKYTAIESGEAVPGAIDALSKLERLTALKDQGSLTDDEFETLKAATISADA